ncbi:transcriptional regulator [Blastochloris tepida]|uniref:Transcriptional regulator n=1 Tax=Blastochloris tepida TaxID=2233851 RepID=A0A348FYL1_9HYPH|nr:transcriptional regulator [Blastochloris tepida]BBF92394.1 hypothetical protein BLTE_10790 [Blastochloris tepida]
MKPATTFADKARAAWGDDLPDWVLALAEDADMSTQAATAKRIGRSGSLVSTVISRSYAGNLSDIEARVRGALMGATVFCRGLGDEIGRDQCRREQSTPFVPTNSSRAALRRACRGCPHARIKGGSE